jgi:hypothetical protein
MMMAPSERLLLVVPSLLAARDMRVGGVERWWEWSGRNMVVRVGGGWLEVGVVEGEMFSSGV